MFSWLPIVGPIIEGILGVVNKVEDTSVAKQVDSNKTDVSVIQARAQVAIAFKDDLGTSLIRDLIMFPVGLWVFFTMWDSTFRNLYPDLTFRTLELPHNVEYIPYAVVAYLFVTAWRK